jgi:hypothetical protein
LGVECGCLYVGSRCVVVYRSCDVGHPSTVFLPSTSFFHPLPHKPFFKQHLLEANCDKDTTVIACTVSSAGGRIMNHTFGHPFLDLEFGCGF